MRLLPLVWFCSGCGRRCIGYRRLPCRVCGSTARTFVRDLHDAMKTRDKAG